MFLDGNSIILFTRKMLNPISRLYVDGFELDLAKLYPEIEFPVSRGTPMIAPLIRWEHDVRNFRVKLYGINDKNVKKSEVVVKIDVRSDEWNFITGHVIDGMNLKN